VKLLTRTIVGRDSSAALVGNGKIEPLMLGEDAFFVNRAPQMKGSGSVDRCLPHTSVRRPVNTSAVDPRMSRDQRADSDSASETTVRESVTGMTVDERNRRLHQAGCAMAEASVSIAFLPHDRDNRRDNLGDNAVRVNDDVVYT
jgi:hypothetical protein